MHEKLTAILEVDHLPSGWMIPFGKFSSMLLGPGETWDSYSLVELRITLDGRGDYVRRYDKEGRYVALPFEAMSMIAFFTHKHCPGCGFEHLNAQVRPLCGGNHCKSTRVDDE